ncbi:hypothetical protein BHE74_00010762 [Ensete ventricosum]|nr:hypothetical protein GW17_00046248 [Ensete ventricosum]RWW80882.1 hypothetical protein BHE74_00010762 [Ensete ventricosum]RZS24049.1 hypothetical protein BHM03_00057072 [Ensete ventricosum]
MAAGRGVGPSAAGPSRPPAPELHQATQAPYQATQTAPSQASSSRLVEISTTEVAEQYQHLSIQGVASSSQAIQPNKVSITPEVTSRVVNRAVMEQLVKHHRESCLGGRLPAYDGRKSLYTAGPLPFTSREFQITLVDEDDGSGMERSFT